MNWGFKAAREQAAPEHMLQEAQKLEKHAAYALAADAPAAAEPMAPESPASGAIELRQRGNLLRPRRGVRRKRGQPSSRLTPTGTRTVMGKFTG